METAIEKESSTYSRNLLSSLQQQQVDGNYSDFTVKVAEEEFHVHKNVMAAASPYFDGMLSHDTEERQNGYVKIIGLDVNVVKQCVEFIYTGKALLSMDEIESLIHASDLLQIRDLSVMCFEFLLENITVENCVSLANSVRKYNQEKVKEEVNSFILRNFEKVVSTEDFLRMEKDDFCSYFTRLSDEVLKWNAAIKWAREENRGEEFVDLLRLIKLEKLSNEFIREYVQTEPLMNESIECKDILLAAFSAIMARIGHVKEDLNERNLEKKSTITGSHDVSPHLHIVVLHEESRMFLKYNLKTKEWSRIVRIPYQTCDTKPEILSLDNTIYLVHGKSLRKFDGNKWIDLASMAHNPSYFRCVVFQDFIFVVESYKTSKYSLTENTWNEDFEGCGLGIEFAVTASDLYIYAVGGQETWKQAKEFDVAMKNWEPIRETGYERRGHSAAWFDGKLCVFGGCDSRGNYSRTEIYTDCIDEWSTLSNLRYEDVNSKALTINGEIYLVGQSKYVIKMTKKNEKYKKETFQVVAECSSIACVIIIDE